MAAASAGAPDNGTNGANGNGTARWLAEGGAEPDPDDDDHDDADDSEPSDHGAQ